MGLKRDPVRDPVRECCPGGVGVKRRAEATYNHGAGFMTESSHWVEMTRVNPDHSRSYVERFRAMAAEGRDIVGEARFIDALVAPGSHVLDAGCGSGRIAAELARRGHRVVGYDVDPVLIEAAAADFEGPVWLVGDLAEMDMAVHGIDELFDAIVSCGNVMAFLAPSTRREVLTRMRDHLAPHGRIAIGFGAGRGYGFDDYRADAAAVGLTMDLELSTWDLRPFEESSDFMVSVLSRPSGADAQN